MSDEAKDLRLFLALTLLFSAPFYVFVLTSADQWLPAYSLAYMWTPALAAIATLLIRRKPLRGLGFALGRPRHYLVAYAVPLAFSIPVYAIVWTTSLGALDREALARMQAHYGVPPVVLILAALIAAPLGIINTLGEEIGWSGLMTPRLVALTGFTRASLWRGLIWSVWHYPLVIALLPRLRPGVPIVYGLACMTVTITAISFVYTWLRIDSGSVWPAALLHAVSLSAQEIPESLTRDTGITRLITFEFGIGFAIVMPLIAAVFWRMAKRS